jgi:exosome complex RNA-binding protein Csl4
MSDDDEISEHEAYQSVMAYLNKQNTETDKKIEALRSKIAELKEVFQKSVPEKPKEEIIAYCNGCKHPLTETDRQQSVCPYCQECTTYTSQP